MSRPPATTRWWEGFLLWMSSLLKCDLWGIIVSAKVICYICVRVKDLSVIGAWLWMKALLCRAADKLNGSQHHCGWMVPIPFSGSAAPPFGVLYITPLLSKFSQKLWCVHSGSVTETVSSGGLWEQWRDHQEASIHQRGRRGIRVGGWTLPSPQGASPGQAGPRPALALVLPSALPAAASEKHQAGRRPDPAQQPADPRGELRLPAAGAQPSVRSRSCVHVGIRLELFAVCGIAHTHKLSIGWCMCCICNQ